MSKKIAIFGGSFNPPGIHHKRIVEMLTRHFDEVIVIPCGPRPDKETTNDVEPIHRAVMADLTFGNMPKVNVMLFDLEQATFTRTHKLDEMLRDQGDVWHVVGTDLIEGGKNGTSFVQTRWMHGQRVWKELRYAILPREGYAVDSADLPPNNKVFKTISGI